MAVRSARCVENPYVVPEGSGWRTETVLGLGLIDDQDSQAYVCQRAAGGLRTFYRGWLSCTIGCVTHGSRWGCSPSEGQVAHLMHNA